MIRLGSNSPTRAKILEAFNIEFIQNGGNFDEDSIKTTNPKEFCYLATKGKFDELYSKSDALFLEISAYFKKLLHDHKQTDELTVDQRKILKLFNYNTW